MEFQPQAYAEFYEVLAPFGITPASVMAKIRDVSFDLMKQPGGMTQRQRRAWDALRKVETRLVADFLVWSAAESQKNKPQID